MTEEVQLRQRALVERAEARGDPGMVGRVTEHPVAPDTEMETLRADMLEYPEDYLMEFHEDVRDGEPFWNFCPHEAEALMLDVEKGEIDQDILLEAMDESEVFTTMRELRPKEVPKHEAVGPERDESRNKECESLSRWNVYEWVEAAAKKVLGSRDVYTMKPNGRKKTRFVVRGFEEMMRQVFATDSPTVAKLTLRVVLSLFSIMGWVPCAVDASRRIHWRGVCSSGPRRLLLDMAGAGACCGLSTVWQTLRGAGTSPSSPT